jgi:hypothetical protein
MDFSEFPDDLVQAARERVADKKDKLAEDCLKDDFDFASHVTQERKRQYSNERKQLAKEIRLGLHDNNMTTRQQIYFELTGKSEPLLPM